MFSNTKKVKANKLKDGDVFFVDLDQTELDNEEHIGGESDLTGTVVPFVVDDRSPISDGFILVNGGHRVWLTKNDTVVIVGHYREIVDEFPDSINP